MLAVGRLVRIFTLERTRPIGRISALEVVSVFEATSIAPIRQTVHWCAAASACQRR